MSELRAALDSLQSRWIANERMPSLNGWQSLAYDAIEALRAALASEPPATVLDVEPETHEPGDHHRYRVECEVCGERGQVVLSIEPQRAEGGTE